MIVMRVVGPALPVQPLRRLGTAICTEEGGCTGTPDGEASTGRDTVIGLSLFLTAALVAGVFAVGVYGR